MAFASGSGRRVAYVAESAFGVTPATPTFKTLRTTGGGMRAVKQTATSDEIQADRNVRDEVLLGIDANGSYPFEFSYGSFDDLIAAVLYSDWSGNAIKNGLTPKSFTFEETLERGATDSFFRFPGTMVNTFGLNIAARERVTGSISLMAKQETTGEAAISGATYTAPSTEPVSTASANVASLAITGLGTAPAIRSLNFEINNGLRTRPVVGSLHSEGFGEGRCEITGSMEAYFTDNQLYEAMLAHGSGALSFNVGNEAGKRYSFLFPRIRFGNGERRNGGNSDDVMVTVPWRAVYDTTELASIKITRAV